MIVSRSNNTQPLSAEAVYSWPGYSDLPGCFKWCFSGCQENGTSTANYNDCGKFAPSANGKGYDQGFVEALGCTTPGCICGNSEIFQRSVQTVYDCAVRYCQNALGAEDLEQLSPDVESLIRVVINFCLDDGLYQSNWSIILNISGHSVCFI